jgi:serine/threonine protein kinase
VNGGLVDGLDDLRDYNLLKSLHKSNFANVLLARHRQTSELFALKTFKSRFDQVRMQSFFASEFDRLRRLSQPTILSPLRFMFIDMKNRPRPTFLFPAKESRKLSEFISSTSPLTEMQKIVVALGLLVGLQYRHSQPCIHGCLNPANILIDKDFFPIIISHGLEEIAKAVKSQIQRSSFEFIAPEIYLGQEKNELSDVSSYGMILYCLFEG